jgi:hypothetical protein
MCANTGTRDTRQKIGKVNALVQALYCSHYVKYYSESLPCAGLGIGFSLNPLCGVLFRICANARKDVADEALLQLVWEFVDHLKLGLIVSGRC